MSDTVPGSPGSLFPRSRYLEEMSRESVAEFRLDRDGERQRLLVNKRPHEPWVVELGRGLRAPEREWLAGALRAWAGQPEQAPAPPRPRGLPYPNPGSALLPAVPAPLADGRIVVERPGPDRLCLHWLPYSGREANRACRGELLFRLQQGAAWLVFTLLFGGIWVLGVARFLRGRGTEGSRSP